MRNSSYLTKKDFLFFIALIIFLLSIILDSTMWAFHNEMFAMLLKLGRYVSYGICAINIVFGLFAKNRFLGMAVMVVITVMSFLGSHNITMILYMLLYLSAYEVSEKKMLTINCLVQSIILTVVIVGSQIGLLEDYLFTPETRLRHGMGFTWTTTGAILFFFITLQYAAIRKEKMTYLELAILELINIYLYLMTDSRMAFYLLTLFIVFMVFIKLTGSKWHLSRFFRKWIPLIPTLLAVFSIALHALYNPNNSLWVKLNELLSSRLRLGKDAIADYGISLLGTEIEWIGYSVRPLEKPYNYVDCSYLRILLEYGVLFLLVVIVIYSVILYKAVQKNNYYLVWSVIFVLVLSVTEPRLMNLAFNPFSILLFCSFEKWECNPRIRRLT